MVVVADIVGEFMAWACVPPLEHFVRLSVNVELRHGLAPPLTMAIEPRHRLLAAGPVENKIGENVRNRASNPIGEHGDTDAAVG
jgi:hypothetical protein